MSTQTEQILSEPDGWSGIDFPLSVMEVQRLSWLRIKIEAVCWLDATDQAVDFTVAKRLAFYRWLFVTGRLSDRVGIRP